LQYSTSVFKLPVEFMILNSNLSLHEPPEVALACVNHHRRFNIDLQIANPCGR